MILTYKHTDDVESTHTPASLFEGDIKLTEEQRTNNMLFGNPEGGTSRAATNVDKIKWPNGVIPYEFDCSVGEYLRGFSSFYKYRSATYTEPQLSLHVREWIRIPEKWEIFAFWTRNPRLWNPEYSSRSPKSRFWLESRIQAPLKKDPESMAWNPECKTVLDSLTYGTSSWQKLWSPN